MMTETPKPTPDDIDTLKELADALEERARHDGLLPQPEDDDEEGVGPQTGVVP